MKGRTLVLVGTVMYVLAWFVPVDNNLDSSAVPGWEAFSLALSLWPGDPWYTGVHVVASALSNLVLVGALAFVLVARRTPSRLLTGILIACAVLNTQWFILSGDRESLRIGYYLWAISFFLIGAGLALDVRRAASGTSPAV